MANQAERETETSPSQPLSVEDALIAEFEHLRAPQERRAATDAVPAPDKSSASSAANPGEPGSPHDGKLASLYAQIHQAKTPRTALCFSGGGIRSATFGLGLVQGMARHGLLESFDYLSTVSGGGYIGSWLSAWVHRHQRGLPGVVDELNRMPVAPPKMGNPAPPSMANLASVPKIDPEPRALQHLRAYSNYLTPQLGLASADTWSIITTYLRNLLLNWLVLLPFLAVVLALPRLALATLTWRFEGWEMTGLAGAALLVTCVGAVRMMSYTDSHRPSQERPTPPPPSTGDGQAAVLPKTGNDQSHFLWGALFPLLLAVAAATAFGAWAPRSPFFLTLGNHLRGIFLGSLAIPFGSIGAALTVVGWLASPQQWRPSKTWQEGVILAVVGFGGGVLLWKVYDVLAGPSSREWLPEGLLQSPGLRYALYVCLSAPLMLLLLFTFSNVLIGAVSSITDDVDREWWARAAAWVLLAALCWTLVSALVLFGPYALLLAAAKMPKLVASVTGATGLITVLVGKSGTTSASRKGPKPGKTSLAAELATALAAPVFAVLLMILIALATAAWLSPHDYARMVSGYTTSFRWQGGPDSWRPDAYFLALASTPFWKVGLFVLGATSVSVGMSWVVNVNKFSMHAMYRNRLTRAYLGASRMRRPNLFSDFQEEDNVFMEELATQPGSGAVHRPFHVLNLTLNLTLNTKLAWQQRKAASFTVSPLHGGCFRLGYRPVSEYSSLADTLDKYEVWKRRQTEDAPPRSGPAPVAATQSRKPQGLTLGTAMTISGAAVSPNMGYHSSPLVAFLLTLFNVRLGWWLGNPGPAGNATYRFTSPLFALGSLVEELMGRSTDTAPYVTLSDGGHFENLGLYEMVLRRCRLIVLSDAGEDPSYSFEDLSNALTKIHTDLGVPIEFTDQVPISKFSTKEKSHSSTGPKDSLGGKYCALAIIRYSAIDKVFNAEKQAEEPAPDGVLVYLKPTLIGQEPADLLHYARSNEAFPHEPTVDEFYSEAQFESYRVLGSHIVDYFYATAGQASQPGKPPAPFERLLAFANCARQHAYAASTTPGAMPTADQLKAALDAMQPASAPKDPAPLSTPTPLPPVAEQKVRSKAGGARGLKGEVAP